MYMIYQLHSNSVLGNDSVSDASSAQFCVMSLYVCISLLLVQLEGSNTHILFWNLFWNNYSHRARKCCSDSITIPLDFYSMHQHIHCLHNHVEVPSFLLQLQGCMQYIKLNTTCDLCKCQRGKYLGGTNTCFDNRQINFI